ncbi:WD repeat-containing protein 26 homolog [Morus notabilis]|uniref:WD repeat-containing protein 26 homolog n=1 Tax=Morus notabilis TaxID=981085 RepID=UPI000CED3D8A|nr:WD repeat-containing protein 26 homolog [Morus notabilis]XP_024025984.1 WD repeat-containing protein 26 homolog [Morus notabilis]XP_024025985.1 WD repeat-containing protein 26 homolog [Morus notabilis]
MGGVEDTEPPLKRVKLPLGGSKSFLEDSSLRNLVICSLGDSMARSLPSQGDGEIVGSKGVIKKSEFVKIITRALYSLGYNKSGAILEEESGIPLRSSVVNEFMQQVVDGKWDDSLATLQKIDLLDENSVKVATFLILEQKFLELLKIGQYNAALSTLRNELVPLRINISQVHELAASVIAPSKCLTLGLLSQDMDVAKSRSKLLEKLHKLLPASVMIPERRLEHLVEQALDVQRDGCAFHNTLDVDISLYSDHHCGRNHIPNQTLQILQGHSDEVWFLQFSHNGKYLASSSKDQSAMIWEVKEDGHVSLKHVLTGHRKPVLVVSWSPDDHQLLTCGLEEVVRRWDVSSGECLHVYEKNGVGLISCGWFADGRGIFSGMSDKSICLWHLDGRELECWKGQRTLKISDMAVTGDGKIISVCRETAILLLDREANFERVIEEEETITSFSLSKDSKFLLVNLINQEIHLWNIEGEIKVVAKYKGHKRARFVIRSCFGGLGQAFVASGSEDSQVYIWHRDSGELIMSLPGHSGAVNCVSWSPSNLHMLASASDDRTIRIWGLKKQLNSMRGEVCQSNEIFMHSQSNGRT